GLPLVHFRMGGGIGAQGNIVKAWIAAGDCAIGGLLAFGGVAIAPFSIGGLAIGFLPFGGCTLGGFALGGLGLGFWADGGVAIGWQAFGGCAIAWSAAFGGAAIAHDFAIGGFAHAAQANNLDARYFIDNIGFFSFSRKLSRYSILTNLIWILPMLFWWGKIRRARIQKAAA